MSTSHRLLSFYMSSLFRFVKWIESFLKSSNMVVHVASVLLTGFFVYISVPGSDLFSWHPTGMSVAFILLLLQVIIDHSSVVGLILNADKVSLPTFIISLRQNILGSYNIKNTSITNCFCFQAIIIFSPESSLSPTSPRNVSSSLWFKKCVQYSSPNNMINKF